MQIAKLPSDGEPLEVRQLGLYELEDVSSTLPDRLYYYEMTLATGKTKLMPYDLDRVKVEPEPPDVPTDQITKGSSAWHQFSLWQTHQAALVHYQEWLTAMEARQLEITLYILRTCISLEDQARIKTAEDMQTIVTAASVEQLTMEVVTRVCETTFQAELGRQTYPGSLIFDAGRWLWKLRGFESVGSANDFAGTDDRGRVGEVEFVGASA